MRACCKREEEDACSRVMSLLNDIPLRIPWDDSSPAHIPSGTRDLENLNCLLPGVLCSQNVGRSVHFVLWIPAQMEREIILPDEAPSGNAV